jgi:RNA polymerase sigma-70 factor (ECF subfamily)
MRSMLRVALTAVPADPGRYARSSGADELLVAAFREGDVRTFDALFARYRQPIFGYIYRSVGDPGLAEELTQEVFLKAFVHLRRTSRDTIFKAWIYRIATTTCIDAHRAATRRPVLVHDEQALALVADRAASDPEQRQIQREQRRAVRRTLSALPAHYRQALILRQLQGLAYAEIGEALGISVEAVTSLIHRARQAFRAAYSRQQGETER